MPDAIDIEEVGEAISQQDIATTARSGNALDEYLIAPSSKKKIRFLGLDFDIMNQDRTLGLIGDWVRRDKFSYVVTPNVSHVVWYDRERKIGSDAADAYAHADLTVCDSRILESLARKSGIELPVVTGSDLTARLINEGGPWSRLAVVGGTAEMHAKLQRKFPHYDWIFHEPGHGLRDDPAARLKIARFVEETKADIIFFAIGAPQSEMCCHEIAQRGRATGVALCIGASLEFLTDIKHRAPRWMQRSKLEWCHRLMSEPKRLWRRYLIESPRVFSIWLRDDARARRAAQPRAVPVSNGYR